MRGRAFLLAEVETGKRKRLPYARAGVSAYWMALGAHYRVALCAGGRFC